jgi:hypothetical protein
MIDRINNMLVDNMAGAVLPTMISVMMDVTGMIARLGWSVIEICFIV